MKTTNMLGGTIKGRYKLIDEVESGSFGTVYIARDKENNCLHAAKIMHSEHANDQELISRFQREAYILQGLSDPHIVRIIDCGNDGDILYRGGIRRWAKPQVLYDDQWADRGAARIELRQADCRRTRCCLQT